MRSAVRLNTLLARLLIGSGIPLVLFVIVALAGGVGVYRLHQAEYREQHSLEVLIQVERQKAFLNQMYLATQAEPLLASQRLRKNYRSNRSSFLESCDLLENMVADNSAQQERIRTVRRLESAWHDLIEAQRQRLATEHNPREEARDGFPRFIEQSDALQKQIQEEQNAFLGAEQDLLETQRGLTTSYNRESIWFISVAAVLAVVLGSLVLFFAARSVTRPIQRLEEAASQLLAGTFRVVPPSGPDEIAELTVHFNHMGLTLTQRTALLQEQEERYRTYIGASSHILWMTNPMGEVISDIPSWRAYTGQSEEAVRGTGWLDALHPEDQPAARAAWAQAVQQRALFDMEYRMKSQSGEYRHFACRAVPILDTTGAVREWIGTCTDITDKKQEAALRRAKEAAEASSRAKTEFLTKMSHELRTPLNAVIGMSRMLLTQRFGPLNAKQADYLADITQAGSHLLALINDILDLAKVEAGRMDLHPEKTSLNELVSAAVSPLQPLAESKGLALRLEMPSDGELATDPGRFKQVLYNLLSNAIKFTPAGSVTVVCQWLNETGPDAAASDEANATAVQVEVRDTGIGIAPEDQGVIWEEFRQLDDRRAGDNQGTGLGLALTRRLVHLLGGHIRLQSQLGTGSTFTVVLPRGFRLL
jgi:PAS domain S-box-containing protein